MLRKAGGNWVDDDKFFDRQDDIDALTERVRDGIHTRLIAQRRMGKTSLVRELLRRLNKSGDAATAYIDLEDARTPVDAVVKIATDSHSIQSTWNRFKRRATDWVPFEEIGYGKLGIKLRSNINAGNWKQRGDEILGNLASSTIPTVLAIDELSIFVNRLIKGGAGGHSGGDIAAADEFLSWLRRNGQEHRNGLCMIVSGSVSIEPILRQAGLSATMNIFDPYKLAPWDHETASACLEELSKTYSLDLPDEVRQAMCQRLRCCIPHHVQQFFAAVERRLKRLKRKRGTLEDVEAAYEDDMLGQPGQADMAHYDAKLKMVLDEEEYSFALQLLTTAAKSELLSWDLIEQLNKARGSLRSSSRFAISDVLNVLQNDGYLVRVKDGYQFESGLLEDWYRERHGQPIDQPNRIGFRKDKQSR